MQSTATRGFLQEMQTGKVYNCWKCGSTFKQRTSLSRHLSEVHERKYRFTCPLCDTHFKRKGDCLRHISRRHKGADFSADDLSLLPTVEQRKTDLDQTEQYKRIPKFETTDEAQTGFPTDEMHDKKSYCHDNGTFSQDTTPVSSVVTETVNETPRNRIGETQRLSPEGLLIEPHKPVTINGNENLCVRKKVKVTRYPNGKTVTVTTYFRHCRSSESGYGSGSSCTCTSDDDET